MRTLIAVAAAGTLIVGPSAASQSPSDVAAYVALSFTPVGALPLRVRAPMFNDVQAPTGVYAQYGAQAERHNYGMGGDFRVGRNGRAGLTLGYASCSGCDGVVMLGADFIAPIARSALDGGTTPSTLTVSANPGIGFATSEDDDRAVSLSLGLPVSVAIGQARTRAAAYVSPGFGFGMVSGRGDSEAGVRPMLGGGVGIRLSPITISASAQKIFIERGETQFGLSLAVQNP